MRRTFFLIGLLIQVAAVFMVLLPNALVVSTGTKVTLKTLPVDPRSILRGDYVTLAYEIARDYDGPVDDTEGNAIVVYAVLEKRGNVHVATNFTRSRPVLAEGQACISGRAYRESRWVSPTSDRLVNTVHFPNIEQYFVTEGFGKELEKERNAHRLFVDLSTTSSCKAVITGVRIGEEAALELPKGPEAEALPPLEFEM